MSYREILNTVLAASVAASFSLAELLLDVNKIGDEGATALAAGVAASGSIVTLSVDNNNIGSAAKKSLDEAMRARLRQIDPVEMKRMLLLHVRACKNKQCKACNKLRERMKSRAAAAAGQGV